MKNTKLSSIILAAFTILTLALDVITENAEAMGISLAVVSKISTLITIIKLVYDNRHLFTEKDLTSFGNYVLKQEPYKMERIKGSVTHSDFENWKQLNK